MTSLNRSQAAPARGFAPWRTREILLAATLGVAFGVVFFAWSGLYAGLAWVQPSVLQDVVYGMWLVPAVLAPVLIRKPGAAIVAEMIAASVSALLGTVWGPDVLLSGFLQGAAAEAVFAITGYRRWAVGVLALAAIASALAAWAHDWWLYYAGFAVDVQLVRLAIMAASAIVFAAFGSLAIERSLRRAGVAGEPAG